MSVLYKTLYKLPIYFWIIVAILILLQLYFIDFPFFWDNILLSSKIAHHYYDTDFSQFWLPARLDSGHPPFFGILLGLLWKILGKSLWVGHLFIGLIVILIFYQFRLLATTYINEKYIPWVLLLLIVEPTMLAQQSQCTNEMVLLLGFLLAVNAIINNTWYWLLLGLLLMVSVNLRGIFLGSGLFLGEYIYLLVKNRKFEYSRILPYVITGILVILYFYLHYRHTGWWVSNTMSDWSANQQLADAKTIIRNLVLIAWRMVDYGRIIVFVLIAILFYKNRKKINFGIITYLIIASFFILSIVLLAISNPIAHRYLLPFYCMSLLLLVYWIQSVKHAELLFCITFMVLVLGGKYIVYKQPIATGWDATPAHWDYFVAREEMLNFIDRSAIGINDIATAFPCVNVNYYSDLRGRNIDFKNYFDTRSTYNYILYSNVMNDFSKEDLNNFNNLVKVYEVNRGPTNCILYRKDICNRPIN